MSIQGAGIQGAGNPDSGNHWDVIVLGLGGVGSSAAYHLAAAGLKVLGIDQFAPVHDQGSSHGHTRVIRQAYFEHPAYVPLLRRAYELWDQVEQQTKRKLFHRTGLVEIGPSDGIVIPGVKKSAATHGLQMETMSMTELSQRWPAIQGDLSWEVVIESNAGYLRVEDCVAAHLELASQHGAVFRHGETVHQWQQVGDGVEVTTQQGVQRSANLVIAAGAWSAQILNQYNVPLSVLRKYQYWFSADEKHFGAESGFPCFFFETPHGYFYGFPNIDTAGVKIARHSGGVAIPGPSKTQDDVDPDDLAAVRSFSERHLHGVTNELRRQAGCYYTMTPDENFVIDQLPDCPQVKVIAGLSGHGFKFTSVLGELAKNMVLKSAQKTSQGHEVAAPSELFRFDRFTD